MYFLTGKAFRIFNCKVDCQGVFSILDLKFTAVDSHFLLHFTSNALTFSKTDYETPGLK